MERIRELSGISKAAIVTITIGTEAAASVFKHLREEEVEQLTIEIARLNNVDPSVVENVTSEFYELCLAQKFVSEGGIEYAKEILEKAFGAQNASILLEKITHSLRTRAFDFIRKIDPQHLLGFIQNEHPQTIALILSYAQTQQASQILSALPREVQIEVAERMAMLDRTSPEIIKDVERALERRLSSVFTSDYLKAGGPKNVAEILNCVDRSTEKFILDELNKRDQALAEEIRRNMFVFEDIVMLDDFSIQKVLREADQRDIMIALKGSSQEVQNVIYANMSKRQAETIKEDMQYLRGVRFRDVEEAQQRIVAVIRRMEEAGEIVINRGGKDDMLV